MRLAENGALLAGLAAAGIATCAPVIPRALALALALLCVAAGLACHVASAFLQRGAR